MASIKIVALTAEGNVLGGERIVRAGECAGNVRPTAKISYTLLDAWSMSCLGDYRLDVSSHLHRQY